MSKEGDSPTTSQFQKGGVVRNEEVAEIVEAAKNGEAALIAGAICDPEKVKDISHRPACLTCARAMAGRVRRGTENLVRQDRQDFLDTGPASHPAHPVNPVWNSCPLGPSLPARQPSR